MATFQRPYKNQKIKDSQSDNVFIKPQNMVLAKDIDEERRERFVKWVTFFRRNPHKFIEDYFEIRLYPYQVMMIWALQKSELAYFVAARGTAKTWIIAVWSLTLAVLYPGIRIVVCAKTIKQAGIIVSEKIGDLREKHPNVDREISKFTSSKDSYGVEFQNGSKLTIVASSDTSRGNRSNYTIIEEARLVPQEVLDAVILPFLVIRTPPYKTRPEYIDNKGLNEEGRLTYITSAWYKSEPWFNTVLKCMERISNGDETVAFLAFDYLTTLTHDIKTKSIIRNETASMDKSNINMEYKNLPSGSSGKSYFEMSLFKRNLKQSFYPQKDDTFRKKNPYDIPRAIGELRFVCVDVATRANNPNDNSIISCIRAIPTKKGYERHLSYMESHEGQHVGVQAERIKEIFVDFDANYIVLDIQNAGISIFDLLSENTESKKRGIVFPPYTVVDESFQSVKKESRKELLYNHTRGVNAFPVIFPISASQGLNSDIASAFKVSLQKKLWKLLSTDVEGELYLQKNLKEFSISDNDSDNYAFFMNPYIQTGLFIRECVNLDMRLVGGDVKLEEKSGAYKDRYSSVSYGNWIISAEFDKNLLTQETDEDELDLMTSLVQFF